MSNNLFIGSNGCVAAIDVTTGEERWRTTLQGGVFAATSSADVSVIARGGFVFAGSQGHLFCLDAESGTPVWHNELKGMGYNDVALAMDGISIQFLPKTERSGSNS